MRGKTNSKRFPKTSFSPSTSKNTFSKNVVLHENVLNRKRNSSRHDGIMQLSRKHQKQRLVPRPGLGENKSHHISQGYKFQSKMQHAFQSKHSHSTPGISIYFHTAAAGFCIANPPESDPKGRKRLSRIPRRTKSALPLMVKLRWGRKLKRQIFP